MTLYRDENGNLESDDFIPRLATDEDLIQRWKQANNQLKALPVEPKNIATDLAMMIVMCAAQLGKRGYTTTGDESDWVIDTVPFVYYCIRKIKSDFKTPFRIEASQNHIDALKESDDWQRAYEGAETKNDFVGVWAGIQVQLVDRADYLIVRAY